MGKIGPGDKHFIYSINSPDHNPPPHFHVESKDQKGFILKLRIDDLTPINKKEE